MSVMCFEVGAYARMRLSYPGAPTESLRTVQLSCVKMDGFRVLQVLLLALWPAQLSWGDIMKLRKFSTDPVNYNIIEIDFEDGLTSPRHGASTVVSQPPYIRVCLFAVLELTAN